VFGDDALVERAPGPLTRVDRLESVPSRSYTDLSRAIRLAVGLFPEGTQRRLVIFTDGNENLGSALADANVAAANDIPVDIVPLEPAGGDEVLVESIQVPGKLEKKKPFDVRITLRSTYSGKAMLRLYKDRNFIGQDEVTLAEGKNIYLFPQQEDSAGFHTYEAMVDTLRDTVRDNNQAGAYTVVYGESRVLLAGADADTRFLREALAVENIPVDTATMPPANPADAENYDAIFLCNLSADILSNQQLRLLQAYCGDLGGGLAMIGGEDSFGLGGFHKTPVEEALPVSMDIRNKKNFPTLGLMILVDKSGSMGGSLPNSPKSKVELAAEAAVAAVSVLTDRDYVGVVGFDSAAKWDCPWTLAQNRDGIIANIRSLRSGGGTDAIPAFNEAIHTLSAAKVQLKHVIFISDGQVQPGDYDRAIRELAGIKATVTGVGIGTDADRPFMERLASATGGRAYFTDDPNAVPRIFTKETVIAQRSYLVEEPFTPKFSRRNEIVKGIDALPPLEGYVATEEKDRAEVVLRSGRDDVVLATWRYRAGKSLAWTSDAKDRWAKDWLGWQDFKKFWGQAARWVMRSRKEGVLNPRVTVESGAGRVSVDAISPAGEFVNFLELEAAVMTPSLETKRVKLRQTAPGRYEAAFEAREVGTYLASVSGDNADPATAGTAVSYPPEYRSMRPNRMLMSQVAAATGGRVAPAPQDFFRIGDHRVETVREMWYHLVWMGLFLFVFDIGVRRLFLDEEQKAVIVAFARRLVPVRAAARRAAAAAATLDALKDRRDQLRHRRRAALAGATGVPTASRTEAKPRPAETKPRHAETKPRPADNDATLRGGGFETPRGDPAGAATREPPSVSGEAEVKAGESAGAAEGDSYTARLLEARRRARERRGGRQGSGKD
jgi:uncharacterized membrane protein/type II secretory pathway pseudopilin PulG